MAKKTNNPTPDKSSNSGQKAKESFKKVGLHLRDNFWGGLNKITLALANVLTISGDKISPDKNIGKNKGSSTPNKGSSTPNKGSSTPNKVGSGRIDRTKEELSDSGGAFKKAVSGALNALCGGAKYLGYKGMLGSYGLREWIITNEINNEMKDKKILKNTKVKKRIKMPADDKEVEAKDLVELPEDATAEFEGIGIDKNSTLEQKVAILIKLRDNIKKIEITARIKGDNVTINKDNEEMVADNSKSIDELEEILETIRAGKKEANLGKEQSKKDLPKYGKAAIGGITSALGHFVGAFGALTSVDNQVRNKNLQKEKYTKVLLETLKGMAGGFGKSLKGVGGTLGNLGKGSWYGIDVADKKIGKKIEGEKGEKRGENLKFLRDNILKGILIILLAVAGGNKVSDWLEKGGENEIENIDVKSVKDFFTSESLNSVNDLKSSGKKMQDNREKRYLGNDDAWNERANGFGYAERRKVIGGMCRMIESGHLQMIREKAIEAGVPEQIVYLALAESGWNANANSGVAGGYWQFTKNTARSYGLIDEKGNDYRSDPVKSTEAAIKHLRDNYDQVSDYASERGYNISENDEWAFALFMFNGSPGLVKAGMDACNGDVSKYSDALVALAKKNNGIINGKKVDAKQNANYVSRILAIQSVLGEIFWEYGYDSNKVREVYLDTADNMYEEYLKNKGSCDKKENIRKLKEIKNKYLNERDLKLMSKKKCNECIKKVNNEIKSYENG